MMIYAVIDTNVLVSSMLTHNPLSPTRQILDRVRDGSMIPMINEDIVEEYTDVLLRVKFRFSESDVKQVLKLFNDKGQKYVPTCLSQVFIDLNDVIFYETYLMRDNAYLVTGNLKHFPREPRIVSPTDMVNIINMSCSTPDNLLNEQASSYVSTSVHIAWETVERMRASAIENGISDMSMDEIDEEIRQYREECRSRRIEDAKR